MRNLPCFDRIAADGGSRTFSAFEIDIHADFAGCVVLRTQNSGLASEGTAGAVSLTNDEERRHRATFANSKRKEP
jgi:hypothetical protein